jgi:hypothetical protein
MSTSTEIYYDPAQGGAEQPEFSADELDSLQVGEALEQNEQQMLAGKYANAEELEQAYLNLQQKMGQQSTDDEGENEEYAEPDGEPSYEYDDDVFNILQEEIDEYGALTEETINSLSEYMDADELVKLGMDMAAPDYGDLEPQEITNIQNFAGGEESYSTLIGWASENLDQQYIEAFDQVVDTANAPAIQLMVAGLMATYAENNGYEGRMLTGRAAQDVGNVQPFRSQAEVVQAMSDPRYDNDPAYRADIMQRLEISNTFIE